MGISGTFTVGLLAILLVALFYFSGRLRFTSEWKADWEGHRIVVRQWLDPLLREGEELVIDDVPVSKVPSSRPEIKEDLYGEIRTNGKVRRVHVHLGHTDEGSDQGCLISVDGIPVGGDIDKRFYT